MCIRDRAAVEPLQVRENVSKTAQILYDFAVNYENSDGRPLSGIFMTKPSKTLYPDYYLLIKYPVAYENIQRHIDDKAYNKLFEVLEDFHLVFANARIYNTEDSLVYQDAIELEGVIIEKYKELSKDINPIDFSLFDELYATQPLVLNNISET